MLETEPVDETGEAEPEEETGDGTTLPTEGTEAVGPVQRKPTGSRKESEPEEGGGQKPTDGIDPAGEGTGHTEAADGI